MYLQYEICFKRSIRNPLNLHVHGAWSKVYLASSLYQSRILRIVISSISKVEVNHDTMGRYLHQADLSSKQSHRILRGTYEPPETPAKAIPGEHHCQSTMHFSYLASSPTITGEHDVSFVGL